MQNVIEKHPWWRGATIYQIYPRSFFDTNNDGIGDLKGCIEKLDYIASLGVDAIWLSPFFTSPMNDFGYDVSNYCDIDPIFGSLTDFDELIRRAHALNLKIIIDQVYSHTSDQHPWFQESRQDRKNIKKDWYVWANPKPDGSPPNNWQSVFGGGSWEWDARRCQYYLHNFLTSQPDLNLHNKDVQNAILDVAHFWLKRGVDGFRIDAINFAMHDPLLRDNPVNSAPSSPPTRPINFQLHIHSQSHPDIPIFLERLRAVADGYGAVFTLAEVAGPTPLAEMRAFTDGDKRLNSAYGFNFLYATDFSPELVETASLEWNDQQGWPAWAFSNHDSRRSVSRWAQGRARDDFAKLTTLVLLSLRGSPILFQGEELGLEQAEIAFEDIQDPEAIKNWPETLGRDGARTPMPWRHNAPQMGFTKGIPWLPLPNTHATYSVDQQEKDKTSVLNFVRKLIATRKKSNALKTGTIDFLTAPTSLLAYIRKDKTETVLIVANFGTDQMTWTPPHVKLKKILLSTNMDKNQIHKIPPCGAYIAHIE